MANYTFTTGQFVRIGQRLANAGDRVLAFLIDAFIMFFLIIFVNSLSALITLSVSYDTANVIIYTSLAICMTYPLWTEFIFKGRTIGKMILGLRVVGADGSKPTFAALFMRWIFFIVEIPTGFALIAVLFNKNNQRMGDMAGGTYVVKTRNAYFGKAMNKQNFPPGYQPVYPQVEKLSQAQIDLISEMYYLNNKNSEWARTQLCKKICNYLNINVTGVSTRNFLSQLTYDFKFITAQQE